MLLALFVLFQARPSLSGRPGRALGNAAPPPSTVPAEEPTGDAPEVWEVEKEESERDKSLQTPEPDKQPLSSPPPPTTTEEPKASAAEATVQHDAPAEPVQQTTETALPVEPTASAGQAELRAFREALQEIKTYIDDKSMVLKEIKTFMAKMASPPDVTPAIQKALEPLTGLTICATRWRAVSKPPKMSPRALGTTSGKREAATRRRTSPSQDSMGP